VTARAVLVNHALGLTEEIDALGEAAQPVPLRCTIPGKAVGKGRPRFAGAGRAPYTPGATVNAEAWVRACMHEQIGRPCLAGPLTLAVEVVRAVPPSWPRWRRAAALAGALHPTGKPDADNILKLLGDAGNGLLWVDDAQLVHVSLAKRYGAEPCTHLAVQALPDNDKRPDPCPRTAAPHSASATKRRRGSASAS
jgi:Holliday junction resolvase RusA-like endonuclease